MEDTGDPIDEEIEDELIEAILEHVYIWLKPVVRWEDMYHIYIYIYISVAILAQAILAQAILSQACAVTSRCLSHPRVAACTFLWWFDNTAVAEDYCSHRCVAPLHLFFDAW